VGGRISGAFHERHTRKLLPVSRCILAQKEINDALVCIADFLNDHKVPPRAAKSLIMRANRAGEVLAGIFVQDRAVTIPSIQELLGGAIKGVSVFYSPPEAPASRPEGLLACAGEEKIYEEIFGKRFPMTILSYFQINPPVFEMALRRMREFINQGDEVLDFFSGVGAIGLSLMDRAKTLTAVELDDASFALLQEGIGSATAVHASDRKARELIDSNHVLIMDPPRAGVHPKVIGRIRDILPPKILYLSCNPQTQVRDLVLLKDYYCIRHAELFNFFPRTPHIESLLVLERL
jgi:23S rRNA (uracil1939-C5)-methyltransferase